MTQTAYAIYRNENDEVAMVATSAGKAGDIIQLPDGRYGIRKGLKPHAAGDTISVAVEAGVEYEWIKKTGDDMGAGDQVYWDPINGYLTTTKGSNVLLALVTRPAGSGKTTVFAALLQQMSLIAAGG